MITDALSDVEKKVFEMMTLMTMLQLFTRIVREYLTVSKVRRKMLENIVEDNNDLVEMNEHNKLDINDTMGQALVQLTIQLLFNYFKQILFQQLPSNSLYFV